MQWIINLIGLIACGLIVLIIVWVLFSKVVKVAMEDTLVIERYQVEKLIKEAITKHENKLTMEDFSSYNQNLKLAEHYKKALEKQAIENKIEKIICKFDEVVKNTDTSIMELKESLKPCVFKK